MKIANFLRKLILKNICERLFLQFVNPLALDIQQKITHA